MRIEYTTDSLFQPTFVPEDIWVKKIKAPAFMEPMAYTGYRWLVIPSVMSAVIGEICGSSCTF